MRDGNTTRQKMLEAASNVIRAKGYAATAVDDICAAAQVTKGGFFHHFASKEELAIAAVEQFGTMAEQLFAAAPYRALPDPVDRLLGYVDFRISLLQGDIAHYTCLLGTLTQEVHATHPRIRAACEKCLADHVHELQRDIDDARQHYMPDTTWTADSLAHFIQAALQGAFILAKAKQGPEVAIASLLHLRRYLELLFSTHCGNSQPAKPLPLPSEESR